MLAYREMGRKRGITKPNMIVSETAHAGFIKGAYYLGMELRSIPQRNMRLDIEGFRREIDSNTVAIVGSAPDFPFGNYDPIQELSDLAIEKGVGLHTDACFGSYLLPFA